MYGIKNISPNDLKIKDPDDLQERFNQIREGANSFEDLIDEQGIRDLIPKKVLDDVSKNLNKAQDKLDDVKKESTKSYKLAITVPLGLLITGMLIAVGFLIKAGFDFAKARTALAMGYSVIYSVSASFYNALNKLEKSQAFIANLNGRDDLTDKEKFEHFEDSGHHDYILDSLKMVNSSVNHIDGREGILKAGISDKILDKRVFKYTKQLKKQSDAVFVPMKRGLVPNDSDLETLIVTLTTLIDNINDISSDINRVTNIDLNSTFGPFLFSIIGKHVKFGDV